MVSDDPGKGELNGVGRLWLKVLVPSHDILRSIYFPVFLPPVLKGQHISGSFGERAMNALYLLVKLPQTRPQSCRLCPAELRLLAFFLVSVNWR